MSNGGTHQAEVGAGGPVHLGLDVGSVSVKLVAVTPAREVIREWYVRHHARPMQVVLDLLAEAEVEFGRGRLGTIAATGAGVSDVAALLG
ncbi:MAG: hypothetical protein KAX80_07115, partial [Planctomycetes bacterium]|nr:hypothetical protein [Planctomycetota bacterium]